jgi:hypothetical protein
VNVAASRANVAQTLPRAHVCTERLSCKHKMPECA